MRLEIFNQTKEQVWNSIVNESINGTLYHYWEWLKTVENHSESRLLPLVFFDSVDDKPFGAVPLFFRKKLGLRMVFSPPPGKSITLGPILVNKGYSQDKFEPAYLDFLESVDEFIKKLRPNYLSIITSPGLLDIRPFLWGKFEVTPLYTYKLNLTPGKEFVWENLSASLKTNINKARKQGISIIQSTDLSSIELVYNSVKNRYVRQGVGFSGNLDYFKDLFAKFGRSAIKTYLAIYQNEVLGSDICVMFKDTVVEWVGGYRSDSNKIKANELLRWYEIEEAIKSGFKWFEIEGANTANLCDSKSRFSPEISIYFSLKKADPVGRLAEKAYIAARQKKK